MGSFELKPTETPQFTYTDLAVFGEMLINSMLTKLGLLDKEISHNAALVRYKPRTRFEKWVNSGKLIPCRVQGKHRWYRVLDCEALEADESRYFLKHVKNKPTK